MTNGAMKDGEDHPSIGPCVSERFSVPRKKSIRPTPTISRRWRTGMDDGTVEAAKAARDMGRTKGRTAEKRRQLGLVRLVQRT